MRILGFTTKEPNMGKTRTYEDFSKFLGTNPHRLGVMSVMYPKLTATFITEGLFNVFTNETGSKNKFQQIDSLVFEWNVDVDYIKRIEFADIPVGNGANGAEIKFAFKELYYHKYDVFKIEGSRQLCFVTQEPEREADDYWVTFAQLVDGDYTEVLDASVCNVGDTTRYISNYQPELSEEGYTKYQSNVEMHRNHISLHRHDIDFSAMYAMTEDIFVKTTDKKDGKKIYTMKKAEKLLMENFLESRNNAMVFGKSNYDKNGKCTIFDKALNRAVPMGDGLIAQIERYAQKYAYGKDNMRIDVMDKMLEYMTQKSENPTGNKYLFLVNFRMWGQIQRTLREYLRTWNTTGTFMFSEGKNKYIHVGNTFASYEVAGNVISFQVDRTLNLEYDSKGYGVCIDLTADSTSGTPAVQMFTLKGGEFIRGRVLGFGGMTGVESGDFASPVAGSKLMHMGYSSIAIFNPYRAYIIEENI